MPQEETVVLGQASGLPTKATPKLQGASKTVVRRFSCPFCSFCPPSQFVPTSKHLAGIILSASVSLSLSKGVVRLQWSGGLSKWLRLLQLLLLLFGLLTCCCSSVVVRAFRSICLPLDLRFQFGVAELHTQMCTCARQIPTRNKHTVQRSPVASCCSLASVSSSGLRATLLRVAFVWPVSSGAPSCPIEFALPAGRTQKRPTNSRSLANHTQKHHERSRH